MLGGEGLSPIEVAKRVKANADRDGWIPGPLQPGILCPLTEMEVRQLYATQRILTPSDETQLAVSQPMISELVSPAVFRLAPLSRPARFHGRRRIARTCGPMALPPVVLRCGFKSCISTCARRRVCSRRSKTGCAKCSSPDGWAATIKERGKTCWLSPIHLPLKPPRLLGLKKPTDPNCPMANPSVQSRRRSAKSSRISKAGARLA